MSGPTILVIASDPKTTYATLHDACVRARELGATVSIAQLVPVANPVLLGDPHAYWSLTPEQQCMLDDCVAAAEGYGVRARVHAMQAIDRREALLQLVELLSPASAYVPAPRRGPAWWRGWSRRRLASAFGKRGCMVIWVESGVPERSRASQPGQTPMEVPAVHRQRS